MRLRWRDVDELERRGRRRLLTVLGIGYILGWLMGYDTARQERRR